MRMALAALAGAVFLFVSGGLLYGLLIASWFAHAMGHLVRPVNDLPLWAVAVEKAVQALLLTVLLARYRPADGKPGGPRQAVLVALLISVPFALSLYGNYPVAFSTAATLGLIDFVRLVCAALLIGAILFRGAPPRPVPAV